MSLTEELSSKVKARLAVLCAHLAASECSPNNPSSTVLDQGYVSAQTVASVGGSLTIVDERTGKKYQVPVSSEGTVKATDFKKITTGKDDKGLKIYDPGYLNTVMLPDSSQRKKKRI